MRVLVTGGAGYIGSHTVRALKARGHEPVVFDNISRGHREAVLDAPLVVGDLLSANDVSSVFDEHEIEGVLHFAALAYVGESVGHPDVYYSNNITGTLHLLDAMRKGGVSWFIFSSTCATYGNPVKVPMDEEHPQSPVNPYGRTKLAVEWMIRDYEDAFGLRHALLRYFNAAGSSLDGAIGEDHDPETHLVPRVLMAASGEIPQVTILGDDWETPDRTCIRDYIHVEDLAEAHVLALERLAAGGRSGAWNLGTGQGHSVRDVIACAEKVTGKKIPAAIGPRRAGDPPVLVAKADRARRDLGWTPRHSALEEIVESAWLWVKGGRRYAGRKQHESRGD